MSRPTYACFNGVYTFLDHDDPLRFELPENALAELLHFLIISPLIVNDLTRGWQECILATDASDAFGFGVSVSGCTQHRARKVGRIGAKRDNFVRLDRTVPYVDDEDERTQRGDPVHLPISKRHFKTVVSGRRQYAAHSGSLEAHGVVLGLRWLLRSPRRHSRRTPVLIDALTVLGASVKGRSSAPSIHYHIREIASLILAGDFVYRPVYIPSEENPADAPSRGIIRRWTTKRVHGLIKARHGKRRTTSTGLQNWIDELDTIVYKHEHLNKGSHKYL